MDNFEMVCQKWGPERATLAFFVTHWGGPYIYLRTCGRAGLSMEWTSTLQMLHRQFIMTRKYQYSKLILNWLSLLENPNIPQMIKSAAYSALFVRTNPHMLTCIAGDQVTEHVSQFTHTLGGWEISQPSGCLAAPSGCYMPLSGA